MGIFSLDSAFGKFMDKVWKWIALNFLCLVCSIPILTIGPAFAALFYVSMKMTQGKDVSVIKDYFRAFKQNFKQGFVIHIIMLLIAVVILLNLYYCKQLQNGYVFYKYWEILLYVIAFIYMMTLIYVYPLLATFKNTVKGTLQNALLLPFTHIGWTLLMVAIIVVPLYLCYVNADIMKWGLFFYMLCGFAVIAFIHSKIFIKIFNQYSKDVENKQ